MHNRGTMSIALAQTDSQIAACYAVMSQLRPHIGAGELVQRVQRQEAAGYRLVSLSDGGRVVCVAGFRVVENLAWGRHMYVDDLVSDAALHGQGHGTRLFAWLVEHARSQGCAQLHLDSGVQRFGAHRFYLSRGMRISSHHFAMDL